MPSPVIKWYLLSWDTLSYSDCEWYTEYGEALRIYQQMKDDPSLWHVDLAEETRRVLHSHEHDTPRR